MAFYRLKHSFTAGELSPLMNDRVDFERYNNGCKVLRNMFCATQGPAIRRPGFKFIYDLTAAGLGFQTTNPKVRMIPFVFNELQAYVMIFYMHTDGKARMVLGTTTQSGEDGLVEGSGVEREYTLEAVAPWTASGTVDITLPAGLTFVSATAYHIAVNDTKTTLVWDAGTPGANEFKLTYVTGTGVATVTCGSDPATGGYVYLTMEFTAAAIATDELVTLTLPTGFDIDKFDWAQSADEMYLAQSGLRPHIIKRHDHDTWSIARLTVANEPADWSDSNGWPERVSFHQQRLVFAANIIRRQTVWLSKSGDFNDFGKHTTLLDSDGVSFTLDSGTQNRIQWVASGKSLHIGTLGNEWTVTGNDKSALTPTNILAQRQTNNGSEPNKPLLVGLTTLFVERHGRTVNEFVYDYTFDSYKTSDMAILSPHLTEDYSITDWAYQQTPDSIIWCVRSDGGLLGITYQRQHKVVGWHRHDTQGFFKTISVIPGNTREDDVWVVTHREIDGADKFFVEKMDDWFKSTMAIDGRFLDSYLLYDDVPTATVSGLTHLVNTPVHILADGTVHPPVTVNGAGEVALNRNYSTVVIGLPYESEVRPHLSEVDSDKRGTSRGRTQRITSVTIDLYRSLGMWVGRADLTTGLIEEEIPFRVPTDLMGSAVALYTGWYDLSFPEGFYRECEYFIKQKQPLPLTVRGTVDNVEVNE